MSAPNWCGSDSCDGRCSPPWLGMECPRCGEHVTAAILELAEMITGQRCCERCAERYPRTIQAINLLLRRFPKRFSRLGDI